jgi:hypothetical protein
MTENPINPDKVAENPGLLPYAHSVGGAVITPLDQGKIKGKAMLAMQEQTHMHLDQIRKQIELLAKQADTIRRRVEISAKIYQAEMRFDPVIGNIYHLYERPSGSWMVSLVGPSEWGRSSKLMHIATVRLLADHTWEVLDGDELYLYTYEI